MAYALVPDGFKLQKVTKLQKQALDEKRTHDDVVALLNNPNTPIVAGGAALFVATPFIIDSIIEILREGGEEIKEESVSFLKDRLPTSLALLTGLGQQSIASLEAALKGALGRVT
jgi:hypothetical protein